MKKIEKLPRFGVAVFVVNSKYEYLLSTQPKAGTKRTWSLPGGNVHAHETIDGAARRAVMEESKCRIQHINIMKQYTSASHEYPDGHFYHIIFMKATVWLGDEFKGSKRVRHGSKNYTIKWFKKKKFPKNLMTPLPNFLKLAHASQELLD